MANNFVVPFNQMPFSTTIKTTTYTIPAGYYGRVRPTSLETDFTIDAVVAIEKAKHIGSSTATTANTVIFTNTSPYILAGGYTGQGFSGGYSIIPGVGSVSATVAYTLGNPFVPGSTNLNNMNTDQTTSCTGLVMPMGSRLVISSSGVGTKRLHFDAIGLVTPDWFWVPSATDLDGTRYIVELYPIPT